MPDDMEDDEVMKDKLEEALERAHPEENPVNDPFATDALGNKPGENAPGGEEQLHSD